MSTKTTAQSKQATRGDSGGGGEKLITSNRKAYHDFSIEEQIEAGLQLSGTEIKSIRDGRVNLRDAYARVERGEIWLYGMHVSPYGQAGNYFNHDPLRRRKLLMHRRQIEYLAEKVDTRGYALVPVRLFLKKGRAKVDIGVGRGKREFDKRDAMAERDAKRQIEQALRQRE